MPWLAASPAASVAIPDTEYRLKEMLEAVADADQPADHREQSKNHQRHQHHHRALMRFAVAVTVGAVAMLIDLRAVIVTPKSHEEQAEHVERRNERGDDADQPEDPTPMFA